jgi:ATP-dependent Clp protease protease subunit
MFWNFKNVEGNETETELKIAGEIMSDDDAWLAAYFGIEVTTPNIFKIELSKYAGKNLTIWIDSLGGDVFAAAGIYTALQEHKKTGGRITSKVEKAISAASVIAMAGDEVLMSPAGIMMIHNPCTVVDGDYREMAKMEGILDEVKQTIINVYELKTKKSRNKISQLMDDETYMNAKKAMLEGFCDGMLYADTTIQNKSKETMLGFFDKHPELFDRAERQPVIDIEKLERQAREFERIKNKLGGI